MLGHRALANAFASPNLLVVDGVADLLFLEVVSALLKKRGKEGLNPMWKIVPLGGAKTLSALVALLEDHAANIANGLVVIRDSEIKDLEKAIKSGILQKKRIFSYELFTALDDSGIEDMFDKDFYLNLVNQEYREELEKPIKKSQLKGGGVRMTEAFSCSFESIVQTDDRVRTLDHTLEAQRQVLDSLRQNVGPLLEPPEQEGALERARQLPSKQLVDQPFIRPIAEKCQTNLIVLEVEGHCDDPKAFSDPEEIVWDKIIRGW